MQNLYYRIWVDAIIYQKAKSKKESGWQLLTIISISFLQGINLLALLFICRWLSHREMPILVPVRIFNMTAINTAIALLLTFLLPFIILNYLLIFYNRRYQKLIHIYPDKNGKLYRNYFIVSVGIIVVPVVFKILFL